MKKVLLITCLIFMSVSLFGQGENNNYEIDSEDIKNVFEGQGIHIFKYPFDLKAGEYISVSYEIFSKGKLTKRENLIEDFQLENEIQIDHHIAKKDTTVFHRFYFFEKNDSLIMRQTLPGIKTSQTIDLSKIVTGSFNSRTDIPQDLLKKHEILFYYGNESEGWLNCSSDTLQTELIKTYDLVILFYAEKISKERTKTILEEVKNKSDNKR